MPDVVNRQGCGATQVSKTRSRTKKAASNSCRNCGRALGNVSRYESLWRCASCPRSRAWAYCSIGSLIAHGNCTLLLTRHPAPSVKSAFSAADSSTPQPHRCSGPMHPTAPCSAAGAPSATQSALTRCCQQWACGTRRASRPPPSSPRPSSPRSARTRTSPATP